MLVVEFLKIESFNVEDFFGESVLYLKFGKRVKYYRFVYLQLCERFIRGVFIMCMLIEDGLFLQFKF